MKVMLVRDGKRQVHEAVAVVLMNRHNQIRVLHDESCEENDQLTRQLCIAHACLDATLYVEGDE